MKKIFLYPQFNDKIGYGHLVRLIRFFEKLNKKFTVEFLLHTKPLKKFPYPYKIVDNNIFNIIKNSFYTVLDFRYYKSSFVEKLNWYTNLIIIDSKTVFKPGDFETVYINITTPIKYKTLADNQYVYNDLSLYPLAEEFYKKNKVIKNKVFVGFGNSDYNSITIKLLPVLQQFPEYKFYINIGTHYKEKDVVSIKKAITENKNFYFVRNYYNDFSSSEKIITSYGLAFIEALILGKDVALYNNSIYHTKLSHYFDNEFKYLGTYKYTPLFVVKKELNKFLKNKSIVKPNIKYEFNDKKLFSLFVPSKSDIKTECPVCGTKYIELIFNNKHKQIHKCNKCRVKFQNIDLKSIKKIYNKKYFTDKYKEQYGNTYIADKDNIMRFAYKRLEIIKTLTNKFESLLDIGCAYGFFLEAAGNIFKNVMGIEINEAAVKYAKNKLKLNVTKKDILSFKTNEQYDVITLWYVFEHIAEPYTVMKKISSMIKQGGLVCFAVPNGNGSLYRFNRMLWFKLHPDDHYFDYTVKSLRIIMNKFGFKLCRYRITGIHPERLNIKNRLLLKFIGFLLRIFKLGDTMELYFRKGN